MTGPTRVVTFIAVMVFVFLVLVLGTVGLILATGGTFVECNRGDCGTVAEFVLETTWPLFPLLFLLVAVAAGLLLASRVG